MPRASRDRSGRREGGTPGRLGWFVLLWLAGVAVTAAVAYTIRFWLGL